MADVQNAPNDDNPLVRIFASDGLGEVAKRIGSSLSLRDQGRLGMAIGRAGEQNRIGLRRIQAAERIQSALKAPVIHPSRGISRNINFSASSWQPKQLRRYVQIQGRKGGRITDKLGRDID